MSNQKPYANVPSDKISIGIRKKSNLFNSINQGDEIPNIKSISGAIQHKVEVTAATTAVIQEAINLLL